MKVQFFALLLGLAGLSSAIGLFSSDALANSAHTSLHGNGQKKESTYFIDGERHGATQRWYPDGSLRSEGRHEHGKMVGTWTWYLPDGSLDAKRSGTYEKGVRLSN